VTALLGLYPKVAHKNIDAHENGLWALRGSDLSYWTLEDFADIKHFGIAFTQTRVTLYLIVPSFQFSPNDNAFPDQYP
jgi:hypothetical protein